MCSLCINDFASLGTTYSLQTPFIKALGYIWNLKLSPRGDSNPPDDQEYVSYYLEGVMGTNNVYFIRV